MPRPAHPKKEVEEALKYAGRKVGASKCVAATRGERCIVLTKMMSADAASFASPRYGARLRIPATMPEA